MKNYVIFVIALVYSALVFYAIKYFSSEEVAIHGVLFWLMAKELTREPNN